ncbi:MAG: sulfurtransferase [Pseudomonadales bacterium]|nr:sulfurtransferase [Pseudomonadales bacterium]
MAYNHPEYLVTAAELEAALGDENLRVFDCAVFLAPKGHGYEMTSGRELFEQAHIPGAGFIDLAEEWADTESELRFTLPQPGQLADAIGASGINANHRVVLYSSGHLMWATRAWWLLKYAGHTNMAILNGNLAAWKVADFPLESGVNEYAATTFTAAPIAQHFADTGEVEAGIDGAVCTINSLSKSLYEGTGDFFYVRRGHIPGSKLVYYDTLLDNEFFLPAEQLRDALEEQGMLSANKVITYCGGGIAATLDAFSCLLCGQEEVAVYDGSMSEWVSDPERPLTVGAEP